MTDGDDASDRADATERRTLLKGIGLGAVGTGALGAGVRYRDRLLGATASTGAMSAAALVPENDVTHRATDGRWAAASTWEDSDGPSDGANVRIPPETTVTVDHEDDARLRTLRVDGTLRFDPTADAHLAVDTIVVMGTGRLELGTADEPTARRARGRRRDDAVDGGDRRDHYRPADRRRRFGVRADQRRYCRRVRPRRNGTLGNPDRRLGLHISIGGSGPTIAPVVDDVAFFSSDGLYALTEAE